MTKPTTLADLAATQMTEEIVQLIVTHKGGEAQSRLTLNSFRHLPRVGEHVTIGDMGGGEFGLHPLTSTEVRSVTHRLELYDTKVTRVITLQLAETN